MITGYEPLNLDSCSTTNSKLAYYDKPLIVSSNLRQGNVENGDSSNLAHFGNATDGSVLNQDVEINRGRHWQIEQESGNTGHISEVDDNYLNEKIQKQKLEDSKKHEKGNWTKLGWLIYIPVLVPC